MNTSTTEQPLFGRYAYPPNELGYCGPAGAGDAAGLARHATEFDGAWPYLTTIADAIGAAGPLDFDVVNAYWVGGPALGKVDPARLLNRLRTAFTGQLTGILDDVSPCADMLAHHSFHVLVVYPWIRFLRRDPATALRIMQDCRIRWGTVESVHGEQATLSSRPLRLDGDVLVLGEPRPETVQWCKDGLSLAPAPVPGATVSAHWHWMCATLSDTECDALSAATASTLDLVNSRLGQEVLS